MSDEHSDLVMEGVAAPPAEPTSSVPSLTRRTVLGGGAALTGLGLAGGTAALSALAPALAAASTRRSKENPHSSPESRLARAHQVRVDAANEAEKAGAATQHGNGDEDALPRRIASSARASRTTPKARSTRSPTASCSRR